MVPTAPRSATGLPIDLKSQAEQVRSIAIERLGRRVGMLDAALQTDLDEALRLHLAL
jgi:mRNA interferase MazF